MVVTFICAFFFLFNKCLTCQQLKTIKVMNSRIIPLKPSFLLVLGLNSFIQKDVEEFIPKCDHSIRKTSFVPD